MARFLVMCILERKKLLILSKILHQSSMTFDFLKNNSGNKRNSYQLCELHHKNEWN